MLVMLLPDQIYERWDSMEGHIERSLPPVASAVDVNQVLYSLLMGSAQCWVLMVNDEEKGFLITTTLLELSNTRTLLIYCAIILDKEAKVDWADEYDTLKKFAGSRECSQIASFVDNEKVVEWLRNSGARCSTFVYADV